MHDQASPSKTAKLDCSMSHAEKKSDKCGRSGQCFEQSWISINCLCVGFADTTAEVNQHLHRYPPICTESDMAIGLHK